jgi:hypothetical protein
MPLQRLSGCEEPRFILTFRYHNGQMNVRPGLPRPSDQALGLRNWAIAVCVTQNQDGTASSNAARRVFNRSLNKHEILKLGTTPKVGRRKDRYVQLRVGLKNDPAHEHRDSLYLAIPLNDAGNLHGELSARRCRTAH